MRISDVVIAIILLILVSAEIYLISAPTDCKMTTMSESYFNLIDDDCDGLIDEDYIPTVCGNGVIERGEYCDDGNRDNLDGCSSDCKVETENSIYIAPYVGNIDGDFNEEWYPMFERMTDFFDKNAIAVGFSFYPASIKTGEFGRIFEKMYDSKYIELIQKSYRAGPKEQKLYLLSTEEQMEILTAGRDFYKTMVAKIKDIDESEVRMPMSYNQPQGIMTKRLRGSLKKAGFNMFFDMYVSLFDNDDYPIALRSTDDFAIIQYGAGMTTAGVAGKYAVFKTPEMVIDDIVTHDRLDIYMMLIDGKKVVPIWVHHQDFERADIDNMIDENKWRTYTETMLKIKEDPNMIIVNPRELYHLYLLAGSSTEIDVGVKL